MQNVNTVLQSLGETPDNYPSCLKQLYTRLLVLPHTTLTSATMNSLQAPALHLPADQSMLRGQLRSLRAVRAL